MEQHEQMSGSLRQLRSVWCVVLREAEVMALMGPGLEGAP